MKLVAHIFLRDLRRFWVLSALALAFVLLEAFGSFLGLWDGSRYALVVLVAQMGPAIVYFVLAAVVVQSDLTVGDRGFWRTRPISPLAVFASKAFFILAVLAVPTALADAVIMHLMRASGALACAVLVEGFIKVLLATFVASLIASVTRSLLQAFATSVGVFLFMLLGVLPCLVWLEGHGYPLPAGRHLAAFQLFLALAMAAAFLHQVLKRRVLVTWAIAISLFPLSLLLSNEWNVGVAVSGTDPDGAVLEKSPGLQIEMLPPAEAVAAGLVRKPRAAAEVPAHAVSMELAVRGIPRGRIVQLSSIASTLSLGDGRTLKLSSVNQPGWPEWDQANERASICRELGLEAPKEVSRRNGSQRRLTLFTITDDQAEPFRGRPADYGATLTFQELAFRVEARLEARPGALWVVGGRAWAVDGFDFSGKGLQARLRLLATSTLLEPEEASRPMGPYASKHGYVLLNRVRGEYAFAHDDWGFGDGMVGPVWSTRCVANFTGYFKGDGTPATGQIDAAWLADSELVVLAARNAGIFKKDVALEGFVLPELVSVQAPQAGAFWQ